MTAADDGYATPAAAVISLAVALVVTSLMARSLSELNLAKTALTKTQADYALKAAIDAALAAIGTSDQPPPYRWTQASLGKAYDVIAEPERAKMSPMAMADLDDASFAALGVSDPTPVRERLRGLQLGRHLVWIADQASSETWRACAATFVSPYGAAAAPQVPIYREPHAGATSASFRAGEVWRIRATDPDGWRDERVIMFTGDGLNPAAVIDRRFARASKGQPQCEDLLSAPSAG
jgi:hypothetical protein